MTTPRQIIEALDRHVVRVVQRLSVNTTANLVETTPVDTGWARANWIPSISSSFDGNTGDFDRESRASLAPGARAQQQAGIARVSASYRLDQGPVYISNNVPYIVRLNSGTSAQAPSGFVQGAITRTVLELRTL